jgi:hypothetical protein
MGVAPKSHRIRTSIGALCELAEMNEMTMIVISSAPENPSIRRVMYPHPPARTKSLARLLISFVAVSLVLVSTPLVAQAAGRTIYVAESGSDYLENGYTVGPGTIAKPLQTITRAIREARPGDTIEVRGGTYVESAGWGAVRGTASSPIVLKNYGNERVVIEGQLQLIRADYWTVDGINVKYDPDRGRTEFLVKFDGGVGWRLLNSEIWGTRGVSNLMISGLSDPPRNYRIAGNCIHDNKATGDPFMNDHNIYLQPGYDTGPGVIERNILFNASNGANIKAAGGDPSKTGAADVTIRYNTMANAGAGVIVGYGSHHMEMYRNLIGPRQGGGTLYTAAILGNTVSGSGNIATQNAVTGYEETVWSTADSTRPVVGSGSIRLDPKFNSMSCSGFKPGNTAALPYGRYGDDSIQIQDTSPDNPFRDDDRSTFEEDIERLAELGVTQGCNPPVNDLFCPNEPVTRGQMAAFIKRALDLPAASNDHFGDDSGSTFQADINALAQAGIARGCNPPANDDFCHNDHVTRGQMAAFLARAFGYQSASMDHFIDDNSSTFEANINAIAQTSVTKGCNPPQNDRYCPGNPVLRGEMAAFLSRAIGAD